MEVKIIGLDGASAGKKKMPAQFEEHYRPDVIKRAVESIESHNRQPYGPDPRAGKKASAQLSKRRRRYRGMYGHGIARTPRKIMSKQGTRFNWVGAFSPNTVGGYRAHPPHVNRIWAQKINDKERKLAIRSALGASINKAIVAERGHEVPKEFPFIISKEFEAVDKTKNVVSILEKIGLEQELERACKKTIRAGKGPLRGRKYKKAKGPLIVVSGDCKLVKAGKNIAGIDVVEIKNINAKLLAPGGQPGRLALFTQQAIEKLEKEGLFK